MLFPLSYRFNGESRSLLFKEERLCSIELFALSPVTYFVRLLSASSLVMSFHDEGISSVVSGYFFLFHPGKYKQPTHCQNLHASPFESEAMSHSGRNVLYFFVRMPVSWVFTIRCLTCRTFLTLKTTYSTTEFVFSGHF